MREGLSSSFSVLKQWRYLDVLVLCAVRIGYVGYEEATGHVLFLVEIYLPSPRMECPFSEHKRCPSNSFLVNLTPMKPLDVKNATYLHLQNPCSLHHALKGPSIASRHHQH
jgi:hypothetical protein